MAVCPKCGQHIKRRKGVGKCRRDGFLPMKGIDMSDLLWWGYRHTEGTLQAKRYFEPLDIQEARESPFVQSAYGPFKAEGRDEALKILEQHV